MVKKFFLILFFSFLALFIIELSSRIFFSIFSKSFYPFYYGFSKNILIFVEDMSELSFSVQNTKVNKVKKPKKVIISE